MAPTPIVPPGWPPALVAAYEEQRLALVRLAYLVSGDRGAAEEIVHDAVLSTLRSWASVRDVGPYLRRAVVNGSRSSVRRRGVEQRHAATVRDDGVAAAPDELWDVLARLQPRQRTALVLRFYEGLPDAEIADVLGCRVATVRTTVHRALAALRREIER